MADQKTTALDEMTVPVDTDIIPVVDDPGGTAVTQHMELGTLKTFVQASLGSNATDTEVTASAGSSLPGVAVTAHATPHSKGTPVELIASTAFATQTIEIIVRGVTASSGSNASMLLDIVTGASLDQVLIPELLVGFLPQNLATRFLFPVAIPAGTRVGVQAQAGITVQSAQVSVRLHAAGTHSAAGTTVTALGTSAATSNGTTLTAPSVANTKPASFDTVIASTAATYRFLVVCLSLPAGTTGAVNGDGLCDIAVGAADSETIILGDIPFTTSSSELILYGGSSFYTRNVASGSRLSARYTSTSTSNGCRCSVAIYGIV